MGGLSKKLGQQNNMTSGQLQMAQQPVTEAGFNTQNIIGLQQAPVLSQTDLQNIRETKMEARNEYIGHENNNFGLKKPNVPNGLQYPDSEMSSLVVEKIWRIVCLKNLHSFYTQQELQNLTDRACRHDYKILKQQWNLPTFDMTVDLSILGLYNIILLADDSGSMKTREPTEDNITRWELLKIISKTISFWATLMDSDGIEVRFLNSKYEGNCICTQQEVDVLFNQVREPSGGTPIGEVIEFKILNGLVAPFLTRSQKLDKPVLVLTITDGEPTNKQAVINAILKCKEMCSKSHYGENAMAFSFAQVGHDENATNYLAEIDTHPIIGHLIDCTSEFNVEQKECGPNFTEAVWVVKTMIGAIDPAYDQADEGCTQSNVTNNNSNFYQNGQCTINGGNTQEQMMYKQQNKEFGFF